eukprot:Awhi_evm1s7927
MNPYPKISAQYGQPTSTPAPLMTLSHNVNNTTSASNCSRASHQVPVPLMTLSRNVNNTFSASNSPRASQVPQSLPQSPLLSPNFGNQQNAFVFQMPGLQAFPRSPGPFSGNHPLPSSPLHSLVNPYSNAVAGNLAFNYYDQEDINIYSSHALKEYSDLYNSIETILKKEQIASQVSTENENVKVIENQKEKTLEKKNHEKVELEKENLSKNQSDLVHQNPKQEQQNHYQQLHPQAQYVQPLQQYQQLYAKQEVVNNLEQQQYHIRQQLPQQSVQVPTQQQHVQPQQQDHIVQQQQHIQQVQLQQQQQHIQHVQLQQQQQQQLKQLQLHQLKNQHELQQEQQQSIPSSPISSPVPFSPAPISSPTTYDDQSSSELIQKVSEPDEKESAFTNTDSLPTNNPMTETATTQLESNIKKARPSPRSTEKKMACSKCLSTNTPYFRKSIHNKSKKICNACGLAPNVFPRIPRIFENQYTINQRKFVMPAVSKKED